MAIMKIKSTSVDLDLAVQTFCEVCRQADPDKQVYDLWKVKDIVAHVTFWHEYYVRNLSSVESGGEKYLLKDTYTDINRRMQLEKSKFSITQLLDQLVDAHNKFNALVSRGKAKVMTYKEGSRDYTVPEPITSVEAHIRNHTKDIKRALNRNGVSRYKSKR